MAEPIRIALLVGARPRMLGCGPVVRLRAGMWQIQSRALVNSVLRLVVDGQEYKESKINGPANIQISIIEAGTEDALDVFAERCGAD